MHIGAYTKGAVKQFEILIAINNLDALYFINMIFAYLSEKSTNSVHSRTPLRQRRIFSSKGAKKIPSPGQAGA